MAKVTAITVSYDRKRQPAPYESEGAAVSLTLAFDEDEGGDVQEQVAAALATAKAQVLAGIGLAAAPAPKSHERGATKAANEVKPAAPEGTTAAAPALKSDVVIPAKDSAPAAAEEKTPEIADMMKAITAAIARMKAAGNPNGAAAIKDKVRAYLPGKTGPELTYANIPATARADFIRDVTDLGR